VPYRTLKRLAAVNEAAVAAGVRAGSTSAAIRELVREAIGGNIRVILDQVKKFAETPPCQ
jgi:hypothetical protein